jgi:nicotinamidase-related amidase
MALPRLRPESTALLVIDVQERLMPTIAAAPRVEANCALLAQAAGIMGLPVICTEQYVRGLGPTVATVRNALPATAEVIEKTRFSALVDGVRATLRTQRRPTVLVCGVEAHVCVLQTALDLLEDEFEVWVVTDACSSRTERNRDAAFDRLAGAGVELVTTEMVLFEWLRTAEHPLFKDIQGLIK